jgi:hypothetical protein
MKWYIPDCYWNSKSNGIFVSHEAVCILNANSISAVVELTLYFEDRDKIAGYHAVIPPERTLHIRLDKLVSKCGTPVPRDTPYAIVVNCEQNITVQYTRVDTSQPEMAIATTIVRAVVAVSSLPTGKFIHTA